MLDALLAVRQREEGVDEPFLALAEGECLLACGPEVRRARLGVGECDLQEGSIALIVKEDGGRLERLRAEHRPRQGVDDGRDAW